MDDKIKFQEMLLDILEVAKVQGNQLGMNEIKELFGDMNLNEEQYEHIFAYLAAHNIKIKGYIEKSNEYTSAVQKDLARDEEAPLEQPENEEEDNQINNDVIKEEDSIYLKMYLEDLEGVPIESKGEIEQIFINMRNGDLSQKTRLLEIYLRKVIDIAQEYKNRGVILEDLIQEGNIGLMYGVEKFTTDSNPLEEIEYINQEIRNQIESAISEELESDDLERRAVDKVSYVSNAAKDLEEDLLREATIDELTAYLKMEKEDVIDILNMSVDAVKLSHNHSSNRVKNDPSQK
ncbi:MAG: sigma factor [Anaerocolumna sp.]